MAAELTVLGGFTLTDDARAAISVSSTTRRLLAYLAINAREVGRISMAGIMWPDATESHAAMSLRTALARMDAPTRGLVHVASASLRLADTVSVDLRSSHALALRLLPAEGSAIAADIAPAAVAALSEELLPDWYDDWVLAAAEDWRALRLNGLETQSRLLMKDGRLPEAGVAARAAIVADPLRESGQAALIKVHIAEGNQSEALRVFDRYSSLLLDSLGLAPTPLLSVLVRDMSA
ncbi:AfsR/SARP family transcriptional regulator [Subtercola endophyticus]|uniref:AfsR/SARP family transcriptional regulator n=1 Tax=Subtercola endophyticus TaxID=2895559 RepID=UPI001E3514A8|nr:BTAD domain-containing putative transcriptional regulator [Subtercola endophyticus]UFS58892.1 transcriptional regulator [Subtercola endophyticus]